MSSSITFAVTLRNSLGEQIVWNVSAPSAAKATVAAFELCSRCEILKVEAIG